MASKQLNATLRVNTSQAEAALKRINKQITAINRAVNKTKATNLEKQLSRAGTQATKLNRKLGQVNSTLSKTSSTANRAKTAITTATTKVSQWLTKQKQVTSNVRATNSQYRTSNSLLGSIGGKLKGIAATYLGIQAIGGAIKTSDVITSAENRFNNLEGGSEDLTAKSMDKIYAAAQRSRSGYTDMLSNVSKTMTLAGDSFQGNIDNAIRFQEIMAKAYTVGGASATEASTSMYQLVQALGSGTLAGDELRSLREGAPLAYKAIEKYAQGVFKTEESLKDLASQGVITSDIVVAAIMNMEKEVNGSFENTSATFAQTWTTIKNTATKAFEPVLQRLNDVLNSDAGKATIEGITNALVGLANGAIWLMEKFAQFFNWCSKNWEWFKYVVTGVIVVIMAFFVKWAAVALWTALCNLASFIQQYWGLLLIVAGIMAILYVYELWRQGTISTTEAIVYCLFIIAAVALVAAIALGAMWLFWVALAVAAVAVIMMYFSEVCGAVTWFGLLMRDVGLAVANFFIACFEWICAAGGNAFKGIGNFGIALGNAISAICTNIGVAFNNAWHGALSGFWDFVASCMEGLDWLSKPISKIAELFGKSFDYEDFVSSIRGKADAHDSKMKDYVSVSDAWNSGMNTYQYKDLSDAWDEGMGTFDVFQDGWSQDYFDVGADWGQGIEDKVNAWGSQFQDANNKNGIFSDLGNLLNLGGLLGNGVPNPSDPSFGLGDAYDPSGALEDINKGLDKLNGTADDIKDSMDLTDDDFEFLRKIAEMEWRNEFTTAEIKIDMTNNNTVNSDRDLDGIVEYLGDVLRSEMTSVANGVHY